MGLRSFHLLFIALSVVLTAFVAAWAFGQYRTAGDAGYIATAAVSLASGVGLAFYMVAFVRKTREL